MKLLQPLRAGFAAVPNRWRGPIRDWLSNNRVLRRVAVNGRDLDIIEAELRALDGNPWQAPGKQYSSVGTSERVVEIPWVVSRYGGEQRVLDVGSAFAVSLYLRHLVGLGITELHGVDFSARPIKGMVMTKADVRSMPYPDGHFQLILCISTLEHVGRDNSKYEIAEGGQTEGDVEGLSEMARVLEKRGRILITVPFGQLEYQSWFKQYDLPAWELLLQRARLAPREQAFYEYSPSAGWNVSTDPSSLHHHLYEGMGAPGATGLLCAELVHS
jgi:O-antigen chain-terminating methyltransferase